MSQSLRDAPGGPGAFKVSVGGLGIAGFPPKLDMASGEAKEGRAVGMNKFSQQPAYHRGAGRGQGLAWKSMDFF